MHLTDWIGRSEDLTDVVTAAPCAALSATFDQPGGRPEPGTPLPPLWHWLYFLPLVRRSEIGALPAVGNFEAMPATGAQYNLALQLTGSNLYSDRDIHGFNLSLLSSELNTGRQISYNNLTGIWGNQASLEPSIRFYTQTDNTGTQVKRLSTGLRLSYKLGPRSSLMGEGIYETSQTDGPSNHETNTAFYYYIGYRYDFQ